MTNIFTQILAKTIVSITDLIPVPDEIGRQEYRPAELSPEELENKQRVEKFRELISIGKQMATKDKRRPQSKF